jgi:rhodanese-related sulfurtransferase
MSRVVREIESLELMERLSRPERPHLLDIRNDVEVLQGVLPEAEHVPMHLLSARIADYPRDEDVVLYCRSGARSYHACVYLAQHGFTNVINLRGGIMAWMRHGLQVTTLPPPGAGGR